MSSQLRLLSLSLSLMLVACGGETKPAAADAKSPDKGAPATAAKPEPTKTAEADKTKVIEGADPIDDRYSLRIDPPADAVAGREGTVKVTVVPKAPWHMNLDFPTSLAIGAPDGVTLAKAEMKKADADKLDENSAEYSVKFTPAAAGDKSFTGKFKFAVCQDEACSPVTEEVEFKVAVK
ncbi:MAG: hypothetical protein IPO88_13280 [Nannocystis sp.]|uniref:hypothetical protein n=1 Tax=Nannocystis sp. TaxID=1962667 RepID=UPI0024232084|nr:hypothetical protein [Nannocystis sp.]MBK9754456.1 hypothetical protein [Nannocystis sp.]